eukprot:TRINITY_DN77123_c0_g1_i1.p1 TRINITY_DN77123_c0_g1~~TRINITY_DN77123_c0_g1_i1.p1  ORF type:complete len:628 (+),score=118.54 TRINITY_DN77123_c0_g1_i1:122-2005(+)
MKMTVDINSSIRDVMHSELKSFLHMDLKPILAEQQRELLQVLAGRQSTSPLAMDVPTTEIPTAVMPNKLQTNSGSSPGSEPLDEISLVQPVALRPNHHPGRSVRRVWESLPGEVTRADTTCPANSVGDFSVLDTTVDSSKECISDDVLESAASSRCLSSFSSQNVRTSGIESLRTSAFSSKDDSMFSSSRTSVWNLQKRRHRAVYAKEQEEPAMKAMLSKQAQRYEQELKGAQADLSLSVLEPMTAREQLERLVRHSLFDQAVSIMLMIHAGLIGLQVELESRGHDAKTVFAAIDIVFAVIFTVELLARAVAYGKKFWIGPDWRWNLFDTALVVTLLGEMIVSVIVDTDGISTILSVLRIGRVVRILRMVRLINSLKQLVYLIMASVNSFFWAAVLMLLLMYCLAVYFTMQCNSIRADLLDEDTVKFWGSVGSSTLTMFKAISSGEDWGNLIAGIGHTSPVSQALFYFYIAFATMVMLNLVTGVFVQGASRIITEEKDREFIAAAVRAFGKFDTDFSGTITLEEFQEAGAAEQLAAEFSNFDFSMGELEATFKLLDADDSGSITMIEFIDGCLQMNGTARKFDLRLMHADLKGLLKEVQTELSSFKDHIENINDQKADIFQRNPTTE